MKTKIIIALSLLVLALSSYMLYDSMNGEMSEAEIETEFNDLKTDYEFMQKDLETKMSSLQISGGVIEIQKNKIEALMKKNSISEEELFEAKKLMQEISQSVLEEFQRRISFLEKEKMGLTNDRISEERELLELNAKIKQLQSENKDINKQYQSINTKYKVEKATSIKKDKLLTYASKISISNFILKGFKIRGNGKEVETEKASRIDRLKISFEFNENKLAESGAKELYIVAKNPDGTLMTFADRPTGNIAIDGKTITFSDKMVVDYIKGQTKTVEAVWDSEEFKRGDYILEVYEKPQNGTASLIGKATKTLE